MLRMAHGYDASFLKPLSHAPVYRGDTEQKEWETRLDISICIDHLPDRYASFFSRGL